MQEISREWEWKIAYKAHIISEWAAQQFNDLVYWPEDISPIDLQASPEWQIHDEASQEDAQEDKEDGQEDVDDSPPSQIFLFIQLDTSMYVRVLFILMLLYIIVYLCEFGRIFMVIYFACLGFC